MASNATLDQFDYDFDRLKTLMIASDLVRPPATMLIRQGEAMGRSSRIHLEIPERGGIVVRGAAGPIDG